MAVRLTLGLALVMLAVSVAVGADLARACSCAGIDPRDRLAEGEAAVIGKVTASKTAETSPSGQIVEYTVQVERAFNASLGEEVRVRGETNEGICGFTWKVGERVGAFLTRNGEHWTTGLCSLVSPRDLTAATKAYPRARGHGRLALLAGGNFAGARVMALGRDGRILGYGFGGGSADEIAVCPGARRAVELVRGPGRSSLVAVRDLRTLRVLRSLPAPPDTIALRCADRSGRKVFAGEVSYPRPHPLGMARIVRLARGGPRRIAAVPGDTVALTATAGYVAGRFWLRTVDLSTGAARRLAPYPDADLLVPGPRDARLAVSGARHGTTVLALPDGRPVGRVSEVLRRGCPTAGWWSADRQARGSTGAIWSCSGECRRCAGSPERWRGHACTGSPGAAWSGWTWCPDADGS